MIKNLLKYSYVSVALVVLIVVVGVLTLGSCDKQSVAEVDRLPFSVECDWSEYPKEALKYYENKSQTTGTMKILLYNQDGTKYNEYDAHAHEANNMLAMLEAGVYKVICVNVSKGVEILNADRFETAQIVGKRIPISSDDNIFYKTEVDEVVIYEPEWIFWSSASEVKIGGVIESENTARMINLPMAEIVQLVNLKINVKGFNDQIKAVKGVLTNVSSVVNLSTGAVVKGNHAALSFELKRQEDGELLANTWIFGNEAASNPELENALTLAFVTEGSESVENVFFSEKIDITDNMISGNVNEGLNIDVAIELEIKKMETGFITDVVATWIPGSSEDIDGL